MGSVLDNVKYVDLFIFYGNTLPYVVEVDYMGTNPSRLQDAEFQEFLKRTTGSEMYEYTHTNAVTASLCIKNWLVNHSIDNVAFDTKECHDNFQYFKRHFLENCNLGKDKKGNIFEISWQLN